MARLVDLLEWLAHPGRERIWVLLDIKVCFASGVLRYNKKKKKNSLYEVDDNADELLTAIDAVFGSVSSPWTQRIILGCWNVCNFSTCTRYIPMYSRQQATFLKAARRILPTYAVAHISYSLFYSRHFSSLSNLCFNIVWFRIAFPFSSWFLRSAQKNDRPLFTWTVNDEYWMEWCLRQNEHVQDGHKMLIDGIITDDPTELADVIERVQVDKELQKPSTAGEMGRRWWTLYFLNAAASVYFLLRRYYHGKMDYSSEVK